MQVESKIQMTIMQIMQFIKYISSIIFDLYDFKTSYLHKIVYL